MIKCEICGKEFQTVIGWKHLKTHNITTSEYKKKYGEVASQEYKKRRSEQNSGENNPNFGNRHRWSEEQKKKIRGRVPPNLGSQMSDEQKKKLRKSALDRNKNGSPLKGMSYEKRYGDIKSARIKKTLSELNQGKTLPDETREKISKSNTGRTSGMLGKTHTKETREKISIISQKTATLKRETALLKKKKMLDSIGYKLINVENTLLTLECDKGHQFTRTSQILTNSKFKETICPVCNPPNRNWISAGEDELASHILTLTDTVCRNVRSIISREIDIYVPDKKLAIEYNGLYWHNDTFKEKWYHLNKTEECQGIGIRLIHVFEDEWINKSEIVKSRINSIFGKTQRIYARNCQTRNISSKDANDFLKRNHLQGSGRANVHLGLYYNDELVSVMTFLSSDISKKVDGWELNRFCSLLNTNVIGGASKLFKVFVDLHNPEQVISFSDRRWETDHSSVYLHLGFERTTNSPPNYWYVLPNQTQRYHRFSLRKDPNSMLTERELRDQQGWNRIWDCGNAKYVWRK